MRAPIAPLIFCLFTFAPSLLGQESTPPKDAAAKARLLETIRERIIWYDDAKTDPHLIPEDVVGLVPPNELPIPRRDQEALMGDISLRRDWRSPAGQSYGDCEYPSSFDPRSRVPEDQVVTLEQAVAAGPVSALVEVERVTKAWWPGNGVYQYNEFSVVTLLVGEEFRNDPLEARAFLTAGGEIVVEGTRLCTLAPRHAVPPGRGDHYLLIGAPDDRGIFHANYFFRIDGEVVEWAPYTSIRKPTAPVQLEMILKVLKQKGSR